MMEVKPTYMGVESVVRKRVHDLLTDFSREKMNEMVMSVFKREGLVIEQSFSCEQEYHPVPCVKPDGPKMLQEPHYHYWYFCDVVKDAA